MFQFWSRFWSRFLIVLLAVTVTLALPVIVDQGQKVKVNAKDFIPAEGDRYHQAYTLTGGEGDVHVPIAVLDPSPSTSPPDHSRSKPLDNYIPGASGNILVNQAKFVKANDLKAIPMGNADLLHPKEFKQLTSDIAHNVMENARKHPFVKN